MVWGSLADTTLQKSLIDVLFGFKWSKKNNQRLSCIKKICSVCPGRIKNRTESQCSTLPQLLGMQWCCPWLTKAKNIMLFFCRTVSQATLGVKSLNQQAVHHKLIHSFFFPPSISIMKKLHEWKGSQDLPFLQTNHAWMGRQDNQLPRIFKSNFHLLPVLLTWKSTHLNHSVSDFCSFLLWNYSILYSHQL